MPVLRFMQTVQRAQYWGTILAMQAYWPCHLGIDNLHVARSISRLQTPARYIVSAPQPPQPQQPPQKAYFSSVPLFASPVLCLHVGGSSSCQRDRSREEAAATTQTVATARASERRNGPCRKQPPHSSTETDVGKGRGRSARCTVRLCSGRCPLPGGWCPVLCVGRRGGRG